MESDLKFVEFKSVNFSESLAFGRNERNRAFSKPHIKNISKQFKKYFDIMPPITVNILTGNVIDGQHRLAAYQTLIYNGDLPADTLLKVMYISVPIEEELQAIIDANTHSKSWSLNDYINCYIKAGYDSYLKLRNWCISNDLIKGKYPKYRYGAAIITGERCEKTLKFGDFKCTQEDIVRADYVYQELLEIIDIFELQTSGPFLETLACWWHQFRNLHSFEEYIIAFNSYIEFVNKKHFDGKEMYDIFFDSHKNYRIIKNGKIFSPKIGQRQIRRSRFIRKKLDTGAISGNRNHLK